MYVNVKPQISAILVKTEFLCQTTLQRQKSAKIQTLTLAVCCFSLHGDFQQSWSFVDRHV
jgi:hypothetical protein